MRVEWCVDAQDAVAVLSLASAVAVAAWLGASRPRSPVVPYPRYLDIPSMVVDGWHEAREHGHESEEARRREAHALSGGVLAAAWVARRRVLAVLRPCILRARDVGHVVIVPILAGDGHEEREHHLDRCVRACV